MTDFRGDWYGLGTIDIQANDVYEVPAIGHGGLEPPDASVLVVFPASGLVIAVQAHRGGLYEVRGLAGTLRDVVD
jgi:hypothetical protein